MGFHDPKKNLQLSTLSTIIPATQIPYVSHQFFSSFHRLKSHLLQLERDPLEPHRLETTFRLQGVIFRWKFDSQLLGWLKNPSEKYKASVIRDDSQYMETNMFQTTSKAMVLTLETCQAFCFRHDFLAKFGNPSRLRSGSHISRCPKPTSESHLSSVQNPSIIPFYWLGYRGSPIGLL